MPVFLFNSLQEGRLHIGLFLPVLMLPAWRQAPSTSPVNSYRKRFNTKVHVNIDFTSRQGLAALGIFVLAQNWPLMGSLTTEASQAREQTLRGISLEGVAVLECPSLEPLGPQEHIGEEAWREVIEPGDIFLCGLGCGV